MTSEQKIKLVDTHAHLNFPDFVDDIDSIIASARRQGITKIMNIGTSLEDSDASLKLSQKYEGVFSSVGVHPSNAEDLEIEKLEKLSKDETCRAIGEIGLDYFRAETGEISKQKESFEKQLDLAQRLDMPAIVHSRDASQDTISTLKNFPQLKKVVFHCFSGGKKTAKKILDLGFFISFTGIFTFPNAENMRVVAREIPLNRMMLETDCPFLAPQKFRGKRNEPAYVLEIAKEMARIKGVSLEELAVETTRNAESFFGI